MRYASAVDARIKVCHIASGDLWAGAEAQIANLLRALVRQGTLNLSAILLNHGRLADELRSLGIETAVIPEGEKGFTGIYSEASQLLAGRDVQILHSHRYKENLLAALVARRCRIPHLVRTQHGLPEPQQGFRGVKQGLIRGLDRFAARRSSARVISVSTEMTRQLSRHMDSRRIVTIPNGIDPDAVTSRFTPGEARERLGIFPGVPVIGTAGRLEPIKRLDLFLQAAARIAAHSGQARFVIAGDGRERQRLQALARALRLEDKVLFLGHRDDVYDVLRALDLLVLSSDHEGLPMVLLEALCLGTTVVARNVGGISEVIRNDVNGILIDSSDPESLAEACVQLLGDPPRRARLSAAGARTVREGFSAQATAAQVYALYRSLMESK